MSYVWDRERICIDGKSTAYFVPIDVLDFPVELISTDGRLHLLWVKDLEESEHWFLLEIEPEIAAEYLKGNKPLRELFENGILWLCERRYETYDTLRILEKGSGSYKMPAGNIYLPKPDSSKELSKIHKGFLKLLDSDFRKLFKAGSFYSFDRRKYIEAIISESESGITYEYRDSQTYLLEPDLLYAA